MVKHIVLWKLKETACGNSSTENARLIKEKLEGLRGRIPQLLALEVGIDFSGTDRSADVALYTEFATRQDLLDYQAHPEHQALVPFIVDVVKERRVADYEV